MRKAAGKKRKWIVKPPFIGRRGKKRKFRTLEQAVKAFGFERKRQRQGPIERMDDEYLDHRDGKLYPRISSILSIVAKPGLEYWWARQAASAALKMPGLNAKAAVKQVTKQVEDKGMLGTWFHYWVKCWLGGTEIEEVPPEVEPYIAQFLKHESKTSGRSVLIERMAISREHGFGVTIDRLVRYGEELWVQDYKTSNGIHWTQALQLAAQKQALEEMYGIKIAGMELLWTAPGFCTPIEVNESLNYVDYAKALWARHKQFKIR